MLRILLPLLTVIALAVPAAADAAVVATVSSDTLTITGDAAADRLALRLAPGAPGTLQLDAGADGSADFAFDRATFTRIAVRSEAGADDIRVDEAFGAFTDAEATTIESGAGADVVTGGRGAEVIAAGDDGDLVLGGGGADRLFLGAGDDTAIQGADDGADVLEGQSGADTLQTAGSGESEEFTVQAVDARVRISRDVGSAAADMAGIETAELNAGGGPDLVDVGDLSGTELARVDADLGLADGARDAVFAAGTSGEDTILASALGDTARVTGLHTELRVENAGAADDRLTLQARAGNDKLTVSGNPGALIGFTLEGNEGIDNLSGGSAAEVLRGGSENDVLRGNGGADTVEAGDGSDLVIWAGATDGVDAISGDGGQDRLRVPTSSAEDAFEVGPAGARMRVSRGLGVVETDGVEIADLGLGGGADTLRVRTGTPATAVVADLGSADLKTDSVTLDGTAGPDTVKVNAEHFVDGLSAGVFLVNAEPGDRMTINGGDGDDQIDASTMTKDHLQPFLNGDAGTDTLIGSPGQDVVRGGSGNDLGLLGGGLDTFNWGAGDGSDIVEGGAGDDFLIMNGSGANERMDVSPIGGRILVTRDVGNVRMDTGGVERFDINPAAGADTLSVQDLSGTDAKVVTWELAPFRGTTASDGAADSVLINGTFGNDAIKVGAGGQQVRTTGLAAAVEVNRADPTLDRLHIDTKPGNDLVSVEPAVHNLITFSSS